MRVCLYEDPGVRFLEPLALTRPAFGLRCGAHSLIRRHHAYFGAAELGAWVRPELVDLCRQTYPGLVFNDPAWLEGDTLVLVNARWVPPYGQAEGLPSPHVALLGNQVAYAVLSPHGAGGRVPDAHPDCLGHLRQALPHAPAGGWMVDYPWDLVERNEEMLCLDYPDDGSEPAHPSPPTGVMVVGPCHRLIVEPGARVEPMVMIDTTRGPVVIARDALVQSFSRLEGPCYVGPGSHVLGARIKGSTIGPVCRVGGEVEASILQGFSNKGHDGFLGHSYLGEWVNLGAGTQVSNLRNDYGQVRVTIQGHKVDTHLTKVGAFLGDHSKTGLGTLINSGSVIGVFGHLLPTGALLPRAIPSFCRCWHGQIQPRSDWREMLTTAAKVMRRRDQELTIAHSDLFLTLYDQTAPQRKEALREGEQRRYQRSLAL